MSLSAEDMFCRTLGKGGLSRNKEMYIDEVTKTVDENRELWKKIEISRQRRT